MIVCDACGNRVSDVRPRQSSVAISAMVPHTGGDGKVALRRIRATLVLCDHCGERSARSLLTMFAREGSYKYDEGPERLLRKLDREPSDAEKLMTMIDECGCGDEDCEVCNGDHLPF